MFFTILQINQMHNAINDLLEYELPTTFVFKLMKISKQLTQPLQVALDTIEKKKQDGLSEEQANIEVFTEEVELDIACISQDELPKEIKGKIIQGLMPIIDRRELNF